MNLNEMCLKFNNAILLLIDNKRNENIYLFSIIMNIMNESKK